MGTGAMPDVMLARSAGLELGETGGVRVLLALRDLGRRASGRPATAASTTPSLHGRRVRIEHWEVARAQGKARGRARCAGRPADYDEVPVLLVRPRRLGDARVRRPGRASGTTRSCAARSRTASSRSSTSRRRQARRAAVGRSDDLEAGLRLLAGRAEVRAGERRPRDLDRLLERRSAAARAARGGAGVRPSAARAATPRSSQPPSGRRSISSRAISCPSAVVTDGRRAPTIPASVRCGSRRRHEHAAGDHAAPALGQAPQQRQQPVVDAREVRDGLHHHEPLGAARGALDERGEDLRPLRGAHGQRLVDDRQPRVASAPSTRPCAAAGSRRRGRPTRAAGRPGRAARRTGGRRPSPRAPAARRARAARSAGCRG